MTRAELVKAYAEVNGMTQKLAKEQYDRLQTVVVDALKAEGEVKLFDGVTLVVKEVAEREARNPQTGETIVVPAHRSPKAKFGKAIKEAINA